MELRVLNYFLTVAREGGLTGASEVLHVTQPTMSRQIQELEEELGLSVSPASLEPVAVVTSVIDFEMPDGQPYHDREHCHLFICRADVRDSDIHTQASEVDGVKWISPDACFRAVRSHAFPTCIDPWELALVLPRL